MCNETFAADLCGDSFITRQCKKAIGVGGQANNAESLMNLDLCPRRLLDVHVRVCSIEQ